VDDRLLENATVLVTGGAGFIGTNFVHRLLQPGRSVQVLVLDALTYAGNLENHEAVRDDPRPEISGHFHPKLRVTQRNRTVSRRCFVAGTHKLILPAFGALTGGLDAMHPEILRAVGSTAEALVPVGDRLLRFPLRTPALHSA